MGGALILSSFFITITITFTIFMSFLVPGTRAIEMTSGVLLPILCYTFLPAYRKFCTDPDPDDLKLSKPKASCEILDKADAVLTSFKKSVDSNLDCMEEAEHESEHSY